jgi:hypothetical protein
VWSNGKELKGKEADAFLEKLKAEKPKPETKQPPKQKKK